MKAYTSLRNVLLLFTLSTLLIPAWSQNYPPAQGPPLPPAPASGLATFILINVVENSIQTTVDTVNARIARDKSSTGVGARLSFTMETRKPAMSVTTLPDKPNQNVVRIAFNVKYKITDISYHGIPYFSRTLFQNIEVIVACKDWFSSNGKLNVTAEIDRPFLDNASFAEQALNFFIGNTLTNFVDSKIRGTLPGALRTSSDIATASCNCLGVQPGTANQQYKDGEVLFAFKKSNRPIGRTTAAFNTGTVKLLKIKRLQARSLPGNDYLYNEIENIQLEFYINQTPLFTEVNNIPEGEERALSLQAVSFPKPGKDDMLVLIGNIEQVPLTGSLKDSNFDVFKKGNNFGNGVRSFIITKSYWSKPRRLPNGGMTKPQQIKVPAYELTVQITVPQGNVMTKN